MRSGTGNTAEFKEDNMSIHVVVMGVAGCGKSTVAEAIHERLGYVYAEGDDFHPQANIDKMSAGIPLTDEDRWPWLKVINTWMVAREALDENTVVSSSALKRSYREVLAQNVPTFFVHLTGSQELIQQRLNERKGHFIVHSFSRRYRFFTHVFSQFGSDENRRSLFHDFLVTALHGTFAFAQMNDVSMLVTKNLELDVMRLFNELLQVNRVVAKGRQ